MPAHRVIESPIGPLTLVVDDTAALGAVSFDGHHSRPVDLGPRDDTIAQDAVDQLGEYFAGARTSFALRLAPQGTPFQLAVWDGLRQIPYGRTTSYGELATRIGRPTATRAVGGATGRNPLAIVIPCHRLIGKDGSLTGFGGGLDRKTYLLDLETRARPA